MMMHALVVLTVGEKDDAGDGVPVPAAVEHLGSHTETSSNVRAGLGDKGFHGCFGRGLPTVRHPCQPEDAASLAREGHDAEPVAGTEAVDDEAHGLLQQRQLVASHRALQTGQTLLGQ